MAELSDLTEHSQGVQPRAEGLFRGKRRVPRAQLSHERRFPRVGRLRRVQASAVFGEENEKRSRRGFQKRLEGKRALRLLLIITHDNNNNNNSNMRSRRRYIIVIIAFLSETH